MFGAGDRRIDAGASCIDDGAIAAVAAAEVGRPRSVGPVPEGERHAVVERRRVGACIRIREW